MRILLFICIALWVLVAVLYSAAMHGPSDDFGAGVEVWVAGLLALGGTLVLAVWAVVHFFS